MRTLLAQPTRRSRWRDSRSRKNGCAERMASSISMRPVPWRRRRRRLDRTNRGDLLGEVDPHRTPGDAAPAADASGGSELVDPGRQLVREPLPVARARRGTHAAAVEVRVLEREARVPPAPALGALARQVGDVLDGRAEARWAYQGAVGTRETARRHVVPARMLIAPVEQLLDAAGVERPPHRARGTIDDPVGCLAVRLRGRRARDACKQRGAALAPHLDQKAMWRVQQLCQREVEPSRHAWTRRHRDAEAGPPGLPAVHGDDERRRAARGIIRIDAGALEEGPVLDRNGVKVAGACADQRETRRRRVLLDDREAATLALGVPQPQPRNEEELFPRMWAERVPEERIVAAPTQPIRARLLDLGPARREIRETRNFSIDDRPVAHGGADELMPLVAESLKQAAEGLHRHDDSVTRLLSCRHRCPPLCRARRTPSGGAWERQRPLSERALGTVPVELAEADAGPPSMRAMVPDLQRGQRPVKVDVAALASGFWRAARACGRARAGDEPRPAGRAAMVRCLAQESGAGLANDGADGGVLHATGPTRWPCTPPALGSPRGPGRRGANSALERVEQLLVLVGDDLALDLEGRRQEPVVDGEVVGQDRELLDLRVGLQPHIPLLDDARDALEDLGVLGERGGIGDEDPLLAGELGQFLGVERDQGHGVGALVAVHHGLADERVALEEVLDVLGRDVDAPGGDDQVLLAVRDIEEAFGVDLADIAGGEPAVGQEYFLGGLGLLEVAHGDIGPAPEDLAVGRDLELHTRLRLPDGAELEVVLPVEGERGTGLGEPVPLEDQDARRVEELGDLSRQGRAAGDGEAQPAAEGGLHLREDEFLGDAILEAESRGNGLASLLELGNLLSHANRPVEDPLLERGPGLGAGHDPGVHLLEDPGHGDWHYDARVNIDYHVELHGHYYSVPYQLMHELVDARLTVTTVELFHRGQRVAAHVRSQVRGRHTTDPAHMPPAHQHHLEWTPLRFITWASTIGPHTAALVEAMLADRPH